MPALGTIHAIARAVCTFQDRACRSGACSPCLERAWRAVRAMREAGLLQAPSSFDAWEMAANAHKGQQDKAGQPYITHVVRVNEGVSELIIGLLGKKTHDQFQSIMQAATLHDVVEDTDVTLDDLLLRGFPDAVIEMVRLLTKAPVDARTYDERITALIDSANLGAILIKLADVEDNGDPARIALLPEDQRGIGERYQRARVRLYEAATALGWRDPRATG